MKLKYWQNFSKRKNSTKIPATLPTEIDIVLKEDTPVDSPSIILTGNAIDIDYCRIDAFGKYYFVGEPIILTDGMTQYNLEEDVLATHKTEVGNTNAHIVYSSTGWDKDLIDNRISCKGTRLVYQTQGNLGFDSVGCYVVSVINDEETGRQGATSYYVMNAHNLYLLLKYMQRDDIYTELNAYFNGSAINYIQNCIWIPISYSKAKTLFCDPGTLPTAFYIGKTLIADYSTTPPTPLAIEHYPVLTPIKELTNPDNMITTSIAIGNKWKDFRDCQPYSSASLYLPGIGQIELNINDFYDSDNVNIQVVFDVTTGDAMYKIFDDNNQLMNTISINTAANVSLAQFATNVNGVLSSVGGAIGGLSGIGLAAATGNIFGVASSTFGVLSSASSAIMAANQRSVSIKGSNSSRSGFFDSYAVVILVQLDTEDCDNANYIAKWGRPVGVTHAISNHSGYVQCDNASVDIAGDNSERDEINSFLNSGFYYE